MDIVDVTSAEAAIDGADIIVAAIASSQPAVMGRWLRPGMHINSVGTARPILREIDEDVLRRSDIIAVDTRHGVFTEAGDCVVAKEWLKPERACELAELVCGRVAGRSRDQQITLVKSVGTAVQDIALAVKIYHNSLAMGLGGEARRLPDRRRQVTAASGIDCRTISTGVRNRYGVA
jgi:ornithine cyclodeaminase/alanine dehydrogenase-like protein (mu-crystallin family)